MNILQEASNLYVWNCNHDPQFVNLHPEDIMSCINIDLQQKLGRELTESESNKVEEALLLFGVKITPVINVHGDTLNTMINQYSEIILNLDEPIECLSNKMVNPRNFKDATHYQDARTNMKKDIDYLKTMKHKYENLNLNPLSLAW